MSNKYVTVNGEVKYTRTPHWVYDHKGLTYKGKMVYGALMRYADNETGKCYPSHKALSEVCGFSIGIVKQGIKQLQDIKVVTVTTRINDSGGQTSNYYTLEFNPPVTMCLPPSNNMTAPQSQCDYELEPNNYNQITNIYKSKEEIISLFKEEVKVDLKQCAYFEKLYNEVKNFSELKLWYMTHKLPLEIYFSRDVNKINFSLLQIVKEEGIAYLNEEWLQSEKDKNKSELDDIQF